MRQKRNRMICLFLFSILLLIGMYSGKTDVDAFFAYAGTADTTLQSVDNDFQTLEMCTREMLSGQQGEIYTVRLPEKESSLKLRSLVQILSQRILSKSVLLFLVMATFICIQMEDNKAIILNYIHNTDGEK